MRAHEHQLCSTELPSAPAQRIIAEAYAEQLFGWHIVRAVRQREQEGWQFTTYHCGTCQTIIVTPPGTQHAFFWCDILTPGDKQQAFCKAWGTSMSAAIITTLEAAEMIAAYVCEAADSLNILSPLYD